MKFYKNLLILMTIIFCLNNLYAGTHKIISQDSLILVPDNYTPPVIDGFEDDFCWENTPWQSIDQVWVPSPFNSVASEDYSGKFKVVWSSTQNLLYFLFEIADDVFVDGFDPDNFSGNIYDFDICEVFIDEDASGGLHMYDNSGQNAENAFAYHIYAPFPSEGEISSDLYVDDMADAGRPNYASHFPEFALRKINENRAIWEFSLIVYNDTYEDHNKDASRVQLTVEKELGLSVAYCDNDDPNENPKQRDNMFGSVWEPDPRNLHWQNADYFGSIKLVPEISVGISDEQIVQNFYLYQNYPNPFNASTRIKYSIPNMHNPLLGGESGESFLVQMKIYDLLGKEITTLVNEVQNPGIYEVVLNAEDYSSGIYFYSIKAGNFSDMKKLILLK